MWNPLSQRRVFWGLLALTAAGEFLAPALLSRRDPDYRPGWMAVSVLGRSGGPVARIYRGWLGLYLLADAGFYLLS